MKCKELNIPTQIFLIKPTNPNPLNQFYQTKSRDPKSTQNQISPIPARTEPGPVWPQLVVECFSVKLEIKQNKVYFDKVMEKVIT